MEKNILALDIGKARCGVAISRSGILTTPLVAIQITNFDYKIINNHIKDLLNSEKIETIVIGYPLYPSGDKCEMTEVVENIKIDLEKDFPNIKFVFQDERNSTTDASSLLHEQGKNAKKQKEIIDSAAACVILERYLEKVNK